MHRHAREQCRSVEHLVCAIAHSSYDGRPHPLAEAMYTAPDSQEGLEDNHGVGRQLGDFPAFAVEVFPSRADHPISSNTSISHDAPDRYFLRGSNGHGLGGSEPLAVSRLGSQCGEWLPEWLPKSYGPSMVTRQGLFRTGLAGTPGGTRIPNLLIRRWTQPVHSRPLRSIPSGTEGFAVHSRP